jgi:hypothetical protein
VRCGLIRTGQGQYVREVPTQFEYEGLGAAEGGSDHCAHPRERFWHPRTVAPRTLSDTLLECRTETGGPEPHTFGPLPRASRITAKNALTPGITENSTIPPSLYTSRHGSCYTRLRKEIGDRAAGFPGECSTFCIRLCGHKGIKLPEVAS